MIGYWFDSPTRTSEETNSTSCRLRRIQICFAEPDDLWYLRCLSWAVDVCVGGGGLELMYCPVCLFVFLCHIQGSTKDTTYSFINFYMTAYFLKHNGAKIAWLILWNSGIIAIFCRRLHTVGRRKEFIENACKVSNMFYTCQPWYIQRFVEYSFTCVASFTVGLLLVINQKTWDKLYFYNTS